VQRLMRLIALVGALAAIIAPPCDSSIGSCPSHLGDFPDPAPVVRHTQRRGVARSDLLYHCLLQERAIMRLACTQRAVGASRGRVTELSPILATKCDTQRV
jgi:hypothetical protein